MSKYTPKPWKVDFSHSSGLARGVSAERRNIINWNGISAATQGESQANAFLIAAAPDLLEALQAIYNHHDAETMAIARAAIAKATQLP